MNDETAAGSTDPQPAGADACPLCGIPLPAATGPTAADQYGRAISFRHCQRCHSLVPGRAEESPGRPDVDDPERGRRLVDRLDADSASLAWELAELLPPPARSRTIVDLGAGRGGLLHALGALGYRVRGCEPSAFLCQMARAGHLIGPDVLVNTDPDRFIDGLADERPSALVLRHVLDRHPDPSDLLDRCRRLAPGATILIEAPVAEPSSLLAEQRYWPTPATVTWLAEEHDLTVLRASLDRDQDLRLMARLPDPDVVDLDPTTRDAIDLEALEAAYRERSPAFAHLVPAPDEAPIEMDGTERQATSAEAEADIGVGFRR